MRGKLYCFACGAGGDGITPAGAGKTQIGEEITGLGADHPRGCGENLAGVKFEAVHNGSPPQVRGKQFHIVEGINHYRITPAGAGRTRKITKVGYRRQDHPRRCGENFAAFLSAARTSGSPPQVRGKLYRAAGIAEKYRITPAGAGKTHEEVPRLYSEQDHPRRCGENLHRKSKDKSILGSPPQVRGKL